MAKNQTLLLVGGLGGCGCLVLLFVFFGIFGFGLFIPTSSPVVAPPSVSPATPVTTPGPVAPVAPAGWAVYTHSGACPRDGRFRLAHFTAFYPNAWSVVPCTEQQPQPYGYVNFHHSSEGVLIGQYTLSYANTVVTPQMIEDAANALVVQLGATGTTTLNVSPFPARGTMLMRRDASFEVPVARGVFPAGTYLIRQIVIPNGAEGISVTHIGPANGDIPAALVASGALLQTVVDGVQF